MANVKDIYNAVSLEQGSKNSIPLWLTTNDWSSITGITLTLKQVRHVVFGQIDTGRRIQLDEIKARKAFRHFMNLLNRSIHGRHYREHNKHLRVIAVLEQTFNGRWHYHVAIEPPTHLTNDQFTNQIRGCWRLVDWGYTDTNIEHNVTSRWITSYLLGNKNGQKNIFQTFMDCVDIDTLHL